MMRQILTAALTLALLAACAAEPQQPQTLAQHEACIMKIQPGQPWPEGC